ncbi:hypothetical protein [Lacrimispora indolis]|uniref:hypothetical protein n=1 Tax=Lacrimispora indolis TaxID=69825 RepID=UPI000422308B|nr:hypothetical protein [[Clostridium] methoxybenzovorans]
MIKRKELEKSIKFFEDEIYQINIALGGILNEDYKEHLKNKKAYYELAVKAIINLNGEIV